MKLTDEAVLAVARAIGDTMRETNHMSGDLAGRQSGYGRRNKQRHALPPLATQWLFYILKDCIEWLSDRQWKAQIALEGAHSYRLSDIRFSKMLCYELEPLNASLGIPDCRRSAHCSSHCNNIIYPHVYIGTGIGQSKGRYA